MTEPQQSNEQPAPEKVVEKPQETVIHLSPTTIHNSIGCQHYFIQVTGTQAECRECQLGVFGFAVNGKVQKRNPYI